MRRVRFLALSLLVASQWAACSTTPSSDSGPVVRFALPADGSMPLVFDVPYPSDVWLDQGRIVDPLPGLDAIIPQNSASITRELAALDGFSRLGFAYFAVDDPRQPKTDTGKSGPAKLSADSLPASEAECISDDSSVYLIDLSAPDAAHARVPCRAKVHDDTDLGSTVPPLLAVGPARGIVLRPGVQYAAVVTSRVRNESKLTIGASQGFVAARASVPIYRDAFSRANELLHDALAKDHAQIVGLAPFTTHKTAEEQFATRDAMEAMPIPKLAWDAQSVAPMGAVRFAKTAAPGFAATLDDYFGKATAKLTDGSDDNDNQLPVRAHDRIAALGTAEFDAIDYLVETPGGYSTPGDHTFARDASGRVVPSPNKPTQKIWVTIAIPDAPMPPKGFPTVIVQHGLGASREYILQLMNVFCNKGWIALGIDSITFGARAGDPAYQVDAHTDYESAPGATYKGPDGIADTVKGERNGPLDLFGNLQNLGAFRDQLRQASLDTAQLVRVVTSDPDLSPLATNGVVPHVDPDRVVYFGESLGSVEGTVAAAISPKISTWTLSVAGGAIVLEAGNHSPGIGTLLAAAATLNFGLKHERLDQSHVLVDFVQLVIEPADPLLFASYLVSDPRPLVGKPTRPRNVLHLEALYDELIGNEGGEAFARAGGWGVATPNVGGNAGMRNVKDASRRDDPVRLADVAPDGMGLIHDTPLVGVTAAVVQFGPGAHGSDIVSSKGTHNFAIPYARFDTLQPFSRLDKTFDVKNPYRELAATVTDFFASSFAGVPTIVVHKAPIRDFDDDGALDDVDPDPSNPAVH